MVRGRSFCVPCMNIVIAAPNALIDEHHENLVLVAKENRATAAHRGYGADLHFDNGFTHITNLVTRLPAKIRIPFERFQLNSNKSTKTDTEITRRRRSLYDFSPFYLSQSPVYWLTLLRWNWSGSVGRIESQKGR